MAAELVERVRQAADALGYVPDPAARALASQRSVLVPVLVPLLSNALFVDVLEAVQRQLAPEGYQMLIGVTHYDPKEEEKLLASYFAMWPAGLLLTGFDRTPDARQRVAASGVPCVHLMETTRANDVYCVGFSQQDAGECMTQHLLGRGYRRIAFVAAQLDPRTLQRAEGYRRSLRATGRYDPSLELLRPEASSLRVGGELFAQLLGVAVPDRVAIAGFNDLAGSEQMLPALTTVRTPRSSIGEASARMLLSLMRGEPVARNCVDLGFELTVRSST